MIMAINYADKRFENAQKYNSYTAKKIGKVDEVIEYGPNSIDVEFRNKNAQYFVEGDTQIGKYGLWRPLIVSDAFEKINKGDYLVYTDSGTYYMNSIMFLVEFMEKKGEEILVFDIPFIEKFWTKRDVFVRLKSDEKEYIETNQRMSTAFVLKKGKISREFVERYLSAAMEYPEIFTDEKNICGKDNYAGFIENRHNQSVLSVITKNMGIKAYKDPTEYGIHPDLYKYYGIPKECFKYIDHSESDYPLMFIQHRSGKVNIKVQVFAFIRIHFPVAVSGRIISGNRSFKKIIRKVKK